MDDGVPNEQNITKSNTTYVIFTEDVESIYIAASSTIIFFGVTLNALVILAYFTKRLEKTHYNFCLLNLSMSSIGEHLGFVPYMVIDKFKHDFDWGKGLAQKMMCGFTKGITLFFIAVFVHAFIIVYMSILRYRMIVKLERSNQKISRKTITIFVVFWVTSAVLMFPNMLTMDYNSHDELCNRAYDIIGELTMMLWGGMMCLLVYIVPMMVLLFTCFCISVTMWSTDSQFKSQVKSRYRGKVVLCLGITAAIFVLSWTPWATYWVLQTADYFGNNQKSKYVSARIVKWVLLPCLGAGVFNVLTNGIVDVKFRTAILSVVTMRRRTSVSAQT